MFWILLLCGLAAAVLAAAYYCYHVCFYSSPDRDGDPYAPMEGSQYETASAAICACTRVMDAAECEWVSITSFDGLKLSARLYVTDPSAPIQIFFHGYRGLALRDCCGCYALSQKTGFNVLAIDQRAHASSSGKTITFGILERRDCLSWVEYAAARFGPQVPVLIYGISMGASTVLMASALPLPDNVAGIIADCPYNTPAAIIRKVCRDQHLPDRLAYPFIRMGARIFGHFRLEEASAEEAVSHSNIPILLFHGEDDRFVPCEMSRRIYDACGCRAELHTFPNAGHGLCYITDPRRYERIIIKFLWSLPNIRPHIQDNSFVQSILHSGLEE